MRTELFITAWILSLVLFTMNMRLGAIPFFITTLLVFATRDKE